MSSRYPVQQTLDLVTGKRIFNTCWFSAGLGISTLQLLLLAQAWSTSQQALWPACIASAWMIGSLVGVRLRNSTRWWGVRLFACALLWLGSFRLVSWRMAWLSTTLLTNATLAVVALLLGAISTAWLFQRRPWPAVGERTALARGLLGTMAGLFTVWVLPAWAGLLALACFLPLLALDYTPAGRCPLPPMGGVVDTWVSRYWSHDRWHLHLDSRALPGNWGWSYRGSRSQDSQGYMPLTLLASGVAVLVGSIWAAVPTSFAAELLEAHELGKLGWLLGGQIGILAIGAWCLLAARSVVGLPDRLLPLSWQSRARSLALSMLVVMGGSLVTLGLPFLQAPWWLALSLASYTLAGAVWGILLPRLRPGLGTLVFAQRHLLLGQGMGLPDTLHLAHGRAQEERVTRLFATAERLLIAVFTPLIGLLIDVYGRFDRVLVIIGLCFLLGLTLVALVSVLRSFDERQQSPFPRDTSTTSTLLAVVLHPCPVGVVSA